MMKKINVAAHRKAIQKLSDNRKIPPGHVAVEEDTTEDDGDHNNNNNNNNNNIQKRNNYFHPFGAEDREFVLIMKHYFEDASTLILQHINRGVTKIAQCIEEHDRRKQIVESKQTLLRYCEQHAIFDGGETALAIADAIDKLVGPGRLPSLKIGEHLVEAWIEVKYHTCAAVIYRARTPNPPDPPVDVQIIWDADPLVKNNNDVMEVANAMRERLVTAETKLRECIEDIKTFTVSMEPMLKVPVQTYKINITE